MTGIMGEPLAEAQFDRNYTPWARVVVAGILFITVVEMLLLPFWWALSFWYGPEFLRRCSARLTTNALEIKTGVFFRKE